VHRAKKKERKKKVNKMIPLKKIKEWPEFLLQVLVVQSASKNASKKEE
jgi:hypothetical protein